MIEEQRANHDIAFALNIIFFEKEWNPINLTLQNVKLKKKKKKMESHYLDRSSFYMEY